jgi:hypothetical protein
MLNPNPAIVDLDKKSLRLMLFCCFIPVFDETKLPSASSHIMTYFTVTLSQNTVFL